MKPVLLLTLVTGLFAAQAALAADPSDLAKAKNCFGCHSVDHKVVGPAFKDVAAKYAGQSGAENKLANKVVAGGGGVWGGMAMPPNTQVTPAEAHVLVKWVLSQ